MIALVFLNVKNTPYLHYSVSFLCCWRPLPVQKRRTFQHCVFMILWVFSSWFVMTASHPHSALEKMALFPQEKLLVCFFSRNQNSAVDFTWRKSCTSTHNLQHLLLISKLERVFVAVSLLLLIEQDCLLKYLYLWTVAHGVFVEDINPWRMVILILLKTPSYSTVVYLVTFKNYISGNEKPSSGVQKCRMLSAVDGCLNVSPNVGHFFPVFTNLHSKEWNWVK